jgi:hypothetical protein
MAAREDSGNRVVVKEDSGRRGEAVEAESCFAEGPAAEWEEVLVVGEEQHLGTGSHGGEHRQNGAGAFVIEGDEEVIEDERHGFVGGEVGFEGGEAEGEEELVAGALAEVFHGDRAAVPAHGREGGFVVVAEFRLESSEGAGGDGGEDFAGASQHGGLIGLPEAGDAFLEEGGGEAEAEEAGGVIAEGCGDGCGGLTGVGGLAAGCFDEFDGASGVRAFLIGGTEFSALCGEGVGGVLVADGEVFGRFCFDAGEESGERLAAGEAGEGAGEAVDALPEAGAGFEGGGEGIEIRCGSQVSRAEEVAEGCGSGRRGAAGELEAFAGRFELSGELAVALICSAGVGESLPLGGGSARGRRRWRQRPPKYGWINTPDSCSTCSLW